MNVRKLRWRFYKKKGGGRNIGLRCKDYCSGCIVCESWKFRDEHGRFPSYEEIDPICEEANKTEHEAWLLTDEGKDWLRKSDERRAKIKGLNSKRAYGPEIQITESSGWSATETR